MLEDRSYGVIALFQNKFLIIRQTEGHWGFPKGHPEGSETERETALRELKEETGTECTLLDVPPIIDEYTLTWKDGKQYHKTVPYFIGLAKNNQVTIQEAEITEYKWATYEEARETLTYDNNKEVLKKAKQYIDEHESRK